MYYTIQLINSKVTNTDMRFFQGKIRDADTPFQIMLKTVIYIRAE